MPLRRAVVRVGDHVLKSYGKDRKLAEAVVGLRTVQGLDSASTAPLEAVLPDLRVTVQGALGGRLPDDPLAAAAPAGRILSELQSLPIAGLPERPISSVLESHVVAVRIVRDIAPELEPRARELLRRLVATRPADPPPVVAHGDFDDGQMLVGPAGIGVFDFDEICATHPAMDPARFAAVIVRRDPTRLDRAVEALCTTGRCLRRAAAGPRLVPRRADPLPGRLALSQGMARLAAEGRVDHRRGGDGARPPAAASAAGERAAGGRRGRRRQRPRRGRPTGRGRPAGW